MTEKAAKRRADHLANLSGCPLSDLFDFLLHRGAVLELKDQFVIGINDYPVNNRVPQILVKFSYEALVRQHCTFYQATLL